MTTLTAASIENRFRLLREVVEGVITVFDAGRVGVRLAPNGVFNDMGSPDYRETFTYVAKQLDTYGLAYLHVMDGLAFGFHELGEPMTLEDFRAVFSGPLMGNCGYTAGNRGGCHRPRRRRSDRHRTAVHHQPRHRRTHPQRLAPRSRLGSRHVVFGRDRRGGIHDLS